MGGDVLPREVESAAMNSRPVIARTDQSFSSLIIRYGLVHAADRSSSTSRT